MYQTVNDDEKGVDLGDQLRSNTGARAPCDQLAWMRPRQLQASAHSRQPERYRRAGRKAVAHAPGMAILGHTPDVHRNDLLINDLFPTSPPRDPSTTWGHLPNKLAAQTLAAELFVTERKANFLLMEPRICTVETVPAIFFKDCFFFF